MTRNKLIILKKSRIHGTGVFAATAIRKGTRIIEYIGRKVTKKQADRVYEKAAKKSEENNEQVTTYLFSINKRYDLDGNVAYNKARYINHSCNPNCETINEDEHIWIVALKDIKQGKELSYDYGFPLRDYKDHPCRCESRNCPGYIMPKNKRSLLKSRLKKKTVVIGLSGGVDSAVAAFLLKKQGYNVIGAFMKNFSDTKNQITGECSWLEEKRMAQKVAAHLGIGFFVFDFEKEYKSQVIQPMFHDYARGLTPNPDSLCNKVIKFPLFWKEAKKIGADCMAMGHYALKAKKDGKYVLKQPKDKKKDQTYFLWSLSQKDLEHTLFPIGSYTKEEVRQIAKKNNFPNAEKKGTVGICFVGKVDLQDFLEKKIKQKPGKIVNPEGEIIGNHPGVMYYTIGQRAPSTPDFQIIKGYRNKVRKKIYIIGKDIKKNTLVVAEKGHPASLRDRFILKNLNLITPVSLPVENVRIRIRHLGKLYRAKIRKETSQIICILNKKISGLAPGQSAAIYKGREILGGGEIRLE